MNKVIKKKKKAFTLIELIIVLAIMAIIAAIAIPNFTAVRDNSKVKADTQSCETIKRTVLMLVADETVAVDSTTAKTITMTWAAGATTPTYTYTNLTNTTEQGKITQALQNVKKPQTSGKTTFVITITTTGDVGAV